MQTRPRPSSLSCPRYPLRQSTFPVTVFSHLEYESLFHAPNSQRPAAVDMIPRINTQRASSSSCSGLALLFRSNLGLHLLPRRQDHLVTPLLQQRLPLVLVRAPALLRAGR